MPERGSDTERGFEIGKDEAWFSNIKRTYDEYQAIGLEGARMHGSIAARILNDSENHSEELRRVSLQALQNAVETANMVGKQTIRHADLAIDHQWNLEPSQGAAENVVLGGPTIEALRTLMVDAVAEGMKKAQG